MIGFAWTKFTPLYMPEVLCLRKTRYWAVYEPLTCAVQNTLRNACGCLKFRLLVRSIKFRSTGKFATVPYALLSLKFVGVREQLNPTVAMLTSSPKILKTIVLFTGQLCSFGINTRPV